MLKIINYFIELCLLKRAPQDLPASVALLVIVITLNILIGALGVADLMDNSSALSAAVLDTLIIMVLLRVVLIVQSRSSRYLQTATAIFGSGIFLGLLGLLLQFSAANAAPESFIESFTAVVYFVLFIWVQLVIGQILKHALDVSMNLGVGLALTYTILSGMMIQMIFLTPSVTS